MGLIEQNIEKLDNILKDINCIRAEKLIEKVKRRNSNNKFYISVVGEFKRGKSTMINSIIGRNILPNDVLPTTATLNVLEYCNEEYIMVVYNDGTTEKDELSKENLERFVAFSENDVEDIEYIKIGIKSTLLKDGLVFIDTPGVNDISKSRVEVTKNILPNCDAAIFLLDAASPLTKSEADFLQTKILSNKLECLLFVISKADRLDEDELEESIEGAKDRIESIIDFDASIIPYSSREVVKAEENGQIHEYKEKLMYYIKNLRNKSECEKEQNMTEVLHLAAQLLIEEIEKEQAIGCLDKEKLEETKTNLITVFKQNDVKFRQLILSSEYTGRKTLHDLFDSSFEIFLKKLNEECIDGIKLQDNVESYYKRIMPVLIEKRVRQYSEEKGRQIYEYIKNLSEHITKEYNKNFQVPVINELKNAGIQFPKWEASVQSSDSVKSLARNMFPATCGALIGCLFMPGLGSILGGAIGQMISMSNREDRNEKLRAEYIKNIPDFLNNSLEQYVMSVHNAIDKQFDELFENIESMNKDNNNELYKKLHINDNDNEQNNLDNRMKMLQRIKNELESI